MIQRTNAEWTRIAVLMAGSLAGAILLYRIGWRGSALLQLGMMAFLGLVMLFQQPASDPVRSDLERSVRKVGARKEEP